MRAQELESINTRKLMVSTVVKLAEKHDTNVSVDGDVKMEKIITDADAIAPKKIAMKRDGAHLTKNIPDKVKNVLKQLGYLGDGNGKIGNRNLLRLIKDCTSTVKILIRKRKQEFISKNVIERRLKTLKLHVTGFHSTCEFPDLCLPETIIKRYGEKFNGPQVSQVLTELFDKWLCHDDMVENIYNAGMTSMNEAFHSILTNKRLAVKNDYQHIRTLHYDSNFALGALYFNHGNADCVARVFDHFNLELSNLSFKKFSSLDHSATTRSVYNKANKPPILAKRLTKQKQYGTKALWRQRFENEEYCSKKDDNLQQAILELTVKPTLPPPKEKKTKTKPSQNETLTPAKKRKTRATKKNSGNE